MGTRLQREVTRFDFAAQRRDMVEHHIAARGVRSESVLHAMRAVRRKKFAFVVAKPDAKLETSDLDRR
jgi:hypothetical protein